jgi:ComF family protein
MLQHLLDALFPRRSLTGKEGEWVTPEEHAAFESHPVVLPLAHLRAEGITHLDRLVAGGTYAGNALLKQAIWTMKFRRISALAGDLGHLLLMGAAQIDAHDAVVVPVPLHWSRRFWRGFNQAQILAKIVVAARQLPYQNLLRRTRPTGFQSHRSRCERRAALHGAFRPIGAAPKRIILIDDVATTGATLDACACVLKAAGAIWVEGWVIVRG